MSRELHALVHALRHTRPGDAGNPEAHLSTLSSVRARYGSQLDSQGSLNLSSALSLLEMIVHAPGPVGVEPIQHLVRLVEAIEPQVSRLSVTSEPATAHPEAA